MTPAAVESLAFVEWQGPSTYLTARTVERYGQSEDAARASLWDTHEHISVTACERVVARSQGGAL